MRGDLAAALLHDPEIVYLDEPTIGLDVVAKQRVRDFLRELNRQDGVTLLLTTHDMSDVEQLCSRVLIIDRGTLLYDGTLDGIRDRFGTHRTLVVDLADDVPGELDVGGARQIRSDGPRRWLQFNRLETTAAELIAEVARRYPLRDLTIEEPDIETIVRHIYQDGLQPVQSAT
jgi:ABC-2 type transport system ATP-binding protein